jgi:hypothetical protein
MSYGESLAIAREEPIAKEWQSYQEAVEELIRAIRQTESARKQLLEFRKDMTMWELRDQQGGENEPKEMARERTAANNKRKEQRRTYLQTVYVPQLRETGITSEQLAKRLPDFLKVEKDGIYHRSGQKLFKLFQGALAFEKIDAGEALARDVYVKRGDIQSLYSAKKHYVRDDFARFTRRFAFVEKSFEVFLILLLKSVLKGKDVGKLPDGPFSKGDFVKAKYGFTESEDSPLMTEREFAFVNQEDGSTMQRGLALSSTSKPLHGNEGYRFGKPDGVNLKVDLARFPAADCDRLMLNLYSFESQEGYEGLRTIGLPSFAVKNRKTAPPIRGESRYSAEVMKQHTDKSTTKNREIVVIELPLMAICGVVFHNELAMNVYAQFVRDRIREEGGTTMVELRYEPHSAWSKEEFYTDH